MIAEMLAKATVFGEGVELWIITEFFFKSSEKEVGLSELFGVCTVDPVFVNVQFISEKDGAEGEAVISVKSGDESRITSVLEKKY